MFAVYKLMYDNFANAYQLDIATLADDRTAKLRPSTCQFEYTNECRMQERRNLSGRWSRKFYPVTDMTSERKLEGTAVVSWLRTTRESEDSTRLSFWVYFPEHFVNIPRSFCPSPVSIIKWHILKTRHFNSRSEILWSLEERSGKKKKRASYNASRHLYLRV